MLLPSKSKSLDQYNTKSSYVSKKAPFWMGLLTYQISLEIIFKISFVDFGHDFSCSKSMFLSKAPTARYKKIWNNFCSIVVFLEKKTPTVESGTHFYTQTQSKMCSKQ